MSAEGAEGLVELGLEPLEETGIVKNMGTRHLAHQRFVLEFLKANATIRLLVGGQNISKKNCLDLQINFSKLLLLLFFFFAGPAFAQFGAIKRGRSCGFRI